MTRESKDEGAVLLTTLLVMGLMASLAVAVIDDVRFAVKRAANVQAYAQVDWYVQGAEEFAQTYLSGQVRTASDSQLNAALNSTDPIIFPYEGGAMGLTVRDGSQCFPLSSLGRESGRRTFRRLLGHLGWDPAGAARLTTIAVDWQDKDNQVLPGGAEDYTYLGREPAYRTPGRPFASVTELRALETMDEEQFEILRPYVCTHSGDEDGLSGAININGLRMAHVPLLAAVLGDNTEDIARQLITERPAEGYADEAQFRASPALETYDLKEGLELLSYSPKLIWIEADVRYLQARRRAAYEFSIADGRVVRLYRGFGEEALRPLLEDPVDE